MTNFTRAIQAKLGHFSPYSQQKIAISSNVFSLSQGTVAQFVQEIEQTSYLLSQQTEPLYAEFYAKRLVQQFDLLKTTVDKLPKKQATTAPVFKSSYRFAKNLAKLPAYKKREEYHKALRALNEKISWLIEQSLRSENAAQKATLQAQIEETEYRKQKCLAAIEQLGDK